MLQPLTDADGQSTQSWRQDRAGFATASCFADILSKLKSGGETAARRNYRMQLLAERLTGEPIREVRASALDWGKQAEPQARMAYQFYSDNFVEMVGFTPHPEIEWCGSSPDGLVGENGMIEIKCPFDTSNHLMTIINASKALAASLLGSKGEADAVPVPFEHLPQIQGNLWVLGREWCDFISFDPRVPEHLRLYVHRVYRDEPYIKNLEVEVRKFLDEVQDNVSLLLSTDEEQPAATTQTVEKEAA